MGHSMRSVRRLPRSGAHGVTRPTPHFGIPGWMETRVEFFPQAVYIGGMKGVIVDFLRLPPQERCKLIEDLWKGRVAYPSPGMPLEIELEEESQSRDSATRSQFVPAQELKSR